MKNKIVVFSGNVFGDCYGGYFKGFYYNRKVKVKKIFVNRKYPVQTKLGFISLDSIINLYCL